MNRSIRSRIDDLFAKLGGAGCPTCAKLSAAPVFLHADGKTPYAGSPGDTCPVCGAAIRHRGKVYVNVDQTRV